MKHWLANCDPYLNLLNLLILLLYKLGYDAYNHAYVCNRGGKKEYIHTNFQVGKE